MITYTLVDSNGTILNIIEIPDSTYLARSTPTGATAILGQPPILGRYYWSATAGAWIDRGSPYGDHILWDPAAKKWRSFGEVLAANSLK